MTPDDPVSRPEHAVERRLDVRIPVSDGLELSANLWLPVAGERQDARCPAILEMIPYRKDDWRANGDEAHGRYFASRGVAFCRLDIRGTGSSPGICLDEYTARETQDGYEAVEWLAAQPWCNGNIGMWGISYGGFTSIQVAALRPPSLKAIVPMYATDDRYTDDVHYVGGVPTASELTQYAISMIADNALPPRPSYRGEGWLDEWRARIEETPIWLVEWLRQQHDGPYWRVGSLAPDYERIEAAMLLFGGWMDSYPDPVFRMLQKCTAPRRAIVGNWVHEYPHDGYPGPNLDWLHEMVQFFDQTLKGVDNGYLDGPILTWFRREWAPPEAFPKLWPGTWVAESGWPVQKRGSVNLMLGGEGRLTQHEPARAIQPLIHRASAGTRGPLSWGAGGAPNGLARDLRPDEAVLPTWTSDPLKAPLDVLGKPSVVLKWRSPVPVATAVVRLSDVSPDGIPTQVTSGILNLTHRDGHDNPTPLPIGEAFTVRVRMRVAGYRFLAGHRIRLSVASAAWPIAWPSPESAVFELLIGGSDAARLDLPICHAGSGSAELPAFKTTPPELEEIGGGSDEPPVWRITEDVLAGTVTVTTFEGGEAVNEDGTRLYSSEAHQMTTSDADPADTRMSSEVHYRLTQDDHVITSDAVGEIASTAAQFRVMGRLDVALDGEPFATRTWDETIDRRLC
jgi:uncharacterized protein